MRRAGGALAFLLIAALLAACATPAAPTGPVANLKPAERPTPGSDEAGLWMQMERAEHELQTSAAVVRDPALHDYLHGVLCRVAGPHCHSVRIYVVRSPEVRASMAPNGMMEIRTGLLLRVANEAQLAFVLGHEMGHFLRRHAIQRWTDIKARSAPSLGANLGAEVNSILAFSRGHEREADQLGFELGVKGGYDPREAPRALERLFGDATGRNASSTATFLATHPPTADRIVELRDNADKAAVAADVRTGREEYVAQLRRIRGWLLNDEVRRRQFASSEALVRRLIDDGEGLGELHFFAGEILRLRGGSSNLLKAVSSYRRALEFPDAPPETLRSLGIVYIRTAVRAEGRAALERYLERRPDAEDRELVRRQLLDLEAAK